MAVTWSRVRSGRALILTSWLAMALGCGSTPAAPIGARQDFAEVEAPGPTVPAYTTEVPSGESVRGAGVARTVRSGIERAAASQGMALEGDPRLAAVAAWIAERLGPDGDPPPTEVVEFLGRHHGLVEPVPHIVVLGQPADMLGEGIASSVQQFMRRQTYNRYGAAVVERGALSVAVVLLSWRWVELSPMPRRVEVGTPLTVRGRLLGDHRNPTVVVAAPSGEVRRLPAGSGPQLDVRVPTQGPGVYQVELVARGTHGDTVIANFPVYVGQEIPRRVRFERRAEPEGQDVESVRRALFELISTTRREAGLSPLREHDGLREVALSHSRDMVENDFVGHTSPRTGSPADRVRAASLTSGLVLENIGRGYGPSEIHRGLMDSPGHRANLLNPDVTRVGIGVVAQPEGGRSAFVVTQLFTRMGERIELARAPAEVLELINRARSARGAPPLVQEAPLAEAAQRAVDHFFADPELSQQDVVDEASASLRGFGIAYRRIGGVMAVVSQLAEAGALEPTLDPGVRGVGLGVAQGTRLDTGPNAIAVVIVLGWPR